ncbi:MAG: nucleoside hydrolase [Acidimicrobiales bacterium]
MTSLRPRIILDCDPGIDDAFAIMCAIRFTDLVAITTVSGNVPIEHTTRNALHVLELSGADVPVHRGASAPLVLDAAFADGVHGVAGLGDTPTPEPIAQPQRTSAVDALLTLTTEAPTTVVAIGPLTNVARALRTDPSVATRIEALHWMGGSTSDGNVTPTAEFNSWADPHAADEVIRSGVPITMYGLNLTRQVRMSRHESDRLRRYGTPTSSRAADFLDFYEAHGANDGLGQPMHDPCAVLGLTHPELVTVEMANIVVGVNDHDRGRTSVHDANHISTRISVARTADAPHMIELIVDAATTPLAT